MDRGWGDGEFISEEAMRIGGSTKEVGLIRLVWLGTLACTLFLLVFGGLGRAQAVGPQLSTF